MNNNNGGTASSCPDRCGTMPACAPLAVPYVPFQQDAPQKYNQTDALSNGTLFPGLNLPFHLKTEGSALPSDPMVELQALEFVVLELGIYLDTHPEDTEAFQLYRQYVAMERTARAVYEEANGPLMKDAAVNFDAYRWLSDPWPWNFRQSEVK